ncbi:hypothetical protein GQ457_11G025530 [Hibiscus cannabinus]
MNEPIPTNVTNKKRVFPITPHQPSSPDRSGTQLKGGGTTEQKWDTPLNRSGVLPEEFRFHNSDTEQVFDNSSDNV